MEHATVRRVTLAATIWREGDAYVSLCPELGVASCGETPEKALGMLKEAVELYVENARRLGLWEEVQAAVLSPQRFTAPLEVALP